MHFLGRPLGDHANNAGLERIDSVSGGASARENGISL